MSFLDACDARLVILQDEPASIADAYGLIKLESRKDRLGTLFVIPNKVASQDSGQSLFNKMNRVCMQFLEEPVNYLHSVIQDDLLSQIIRRRESLLTDHPSSRAATNFRNFAKSLVALLNSQKFTANPAEKVN
jgi:flagellar biosynthesis protein FlhG